MAIFHMTVKMVSRSKGQSAVAKTAYNARDKLTNEQTGERHDYHRHKGLLFSGLFVPEGAPTWAHDRQGLWSAVERKETRKNSQLAREIEVSLPHELTPEQRAWLVQDFVREQFVRRGIVADVAIHAPDRQGDERNYHAHILLTTRVMTPEGFGAKARDLDSREQLAQWRQQWEHLANRHLERHGHAMRIDHRSLEAQGIDREPTQHLGPDVVEMERKGQATDRGDQAREIGKRNRQRVTLQAELGGVDRELQALALEQSQAEALTPAQSEREKRRLILEEARQQLGIRSPADDFADRVAATAGTPLMVASDVAGKVAEKLVDVVEGLLAILAPPPPRMTTSALLSADAATRRAYTAQQRADEQAKRASDHALDRIAAAMRRGMALSRSDVQAMPYAELVHIRDKGDDALRALVKAREEEQQREYGGRERTRER